MRAGLARKLDSKYLIDSLHIFALWGFAVAQPIYDLLGQNAEFFVFRRSETVDIVLLAVGLSLLGPTAFLLLEVVVGWLGQKCRKGIHGLIIATLVTLIALQALKRADQLSGTVIVEVGAILGLAVTIGYFRYRLA